MPLLLSRAEQNWTSQSESSETVFFGGSNRTEDLNALDNFSTRFPFTLGTNSYPSIEHGFQALKFESAGDQAYAEEIRTCSSPREAKDLGRAKKLSREHLDRWKSHLAEESMRQCLQAKFEQHAEAAEILKRTGPAVLVEQVQDDPTWDDKVWGCGKDGVGRNLMGILLMEIRALLQYKS